MTRASEALHIAQPALSQQMHNLEEYLGVKLFHRTANGVRPTAAALILRTQGRQILRQIEEATQMVRNEQDTPTGEVSIALASSTAKALAIPLLLEVRRLYPGISLEFIESPSADIVRLIETGNADMAVAVDINQTNMISQIPLIEEKLYLVSLPTEQFKNTKKPIPVSKLAKIPLILATHPNSIREFLTNSLRRSNLQLTLVAEINSTSLMLQAVRAGVGCSVLPLSAVDEDIKAKQLIAIPFSGPGPSRKLTLCTLPKSNQTIASMAVHALIPEVIKKLITDGTWTGAELL